MPALGIVLLFLLSGMFVAVSVDESYADYFDVHPKDEGEIVVKTGGTIYYESVFHRDSTGNADVEFTAYLLKPNGDKHAGGVSPSTWTSTSAEDTKNIKITAPDTAGTYRLVVEYEIDDEDNPKKGVSQTMVKVVVPITLKAEVINNSNIKSSITVAFWVDGELVADSEQTVSEIAPGGKKTVTYEWVTGSLSEGRHTYELRAENGESIEVSEFYIGHNEYRWASILMGVLFVILAIVLLYVLRKPVKNYGKPKGRR